MKSLILSNVRGNWPALEAVLAAEPDANHVLCLGDLVGYGPQPAECVAWAMQLNPPSRVVCASARTGAREWRQRNETKFLCPHPPARLTSEMRQFLAGLQPFQQFDWDGAACFACQRIGRQPLDAAAFERLATPFWNATELTRMDTDLILTGVPGKLYVLVGHPDFLFLADSCRALQTELNGTTVVNPGSVGVSADGEPRAAYAVWENSSVTLHQVTYDIGETILAHDQLNTDSQFRRQFVNTLCTGTRPGAQQSAEPAMES
jgi:hypothetical protein